MSKPILNKLYFSPVKSLSFSSEKILKIKKNIGIQNDRIFALTRIIDEAEANNYMNNPNKRNLKFFLTLKNSPFLNKYNFEFKENKLSLFFEKDLIKEINLNNENNLNLISKELKKRESLINYIPYLIKNLEHPFFDTMPQNSISLINLNSIKDFEKKIDYKINHQRFRGNIYINNIKPWIEFSWIGKKIIINDCSFTVLKKIPRCSATNLRLNSDIFDINVPQKLKEVYGHINMGVYLLPLNNGTININNKIKLV